MLKKTTGADVFYQRIFQTQNNIQTLKISTEKNMQNQLTLFQEDSHANLSALQVKEREKTTTVISGKKCLELYRRFNQPMLLAKMLLESSVWHSTRCFLTWKHRTTPQKRLLSQLAVKMRGTKEIECGLWLTPTASDGLMSKKKLDNLYITENGTVRLRNKQGTSSNAGLANQVLFFPTPMASDGKTAYQGTNRQGKQVNLETHIRNTMQTSGKLNPEWVEWFMGYPIGWTELKD